MKKIQKVNNKPLYVAISLLVVASFAFTGWLLAQTYGGNQITNSNVSIDQRTEVEASAFTGEGNFGGVDIVSTVNAFSRYYLVALGDNNRNVGGELQFDVGSTNSNFERFGYFGGDCADATTTQFFHQNKKGQSIYVVDAYMRITEVPTTSVKFGIGTSSDQFSSRHPNILNNTLFNHTPPVLQINDAGGGDAGFQGNTTTGSLASILYTGDITGGGANTATNTTFWLNDFKNLDVRDGEGYWNSIEVKSDEFVVGVATSSNPGAVNSASGDGVALWNCEYGILFKYTDVD